MKLSTSFLFSGEVGGGRVEPLRVVDEEKKKSEEASIGVMGSEYSGAG